MKRHSLFQRRCLQLTLWLWLLSAAPAAAQEQAGLARAQQALAEAERLRAQDQADALQAALPKYQEALRLFATAGERKQQAITLNQIGRVYTELGEGTKALDYYQHALPLARQAGDKLSEAEILNNLGVAYSGAGYPEQALAYYEQALPLYKAVRDRNGEVVTLNNLAGIYRAQKGNRARDYYEKALAIAQAAGDRANEAGTLLNLGSFYLLQKQRPEALDHLNRALALWRTLGDRRREAATLTNLGVLHADANEKPLARDFFYQALPLWRLMGDRAGEDRTLTQIRRLEAAEDGRQALPALIRGYEEQMRRLRTGKAKDLKGEAGVLNQIGRAYAEAGEYRKAIDSLSQALPLWRVSGAREQESATLLQLGECATALGRRQEARDFYEQVVTLWRSTRNRQAEAQALGEMGRVYDGAGDKPQAHNYYAAALRLWRELNKPQETARALLRLSDLQQDLGERQRAFDGYAEARRLFQAENDRSGEAAALAGGGAVYAALNDPARALELYQQALALFRAANDASGEAQTLTLIGAAEAETGQAAAALEHYQQARALRRTLGQRREEARLSSSIGALQLTLGTAAQARAQHEQALHLLRGAGDRAAEAVTLHQLAATYAALNDKAKARDHYAQAFVLFRAVGNGSGAAAALYELARLERERNNFNAARRQIEAALVIVEGLRARVLNRELRAGYFAAVQDYYEFYIELLMQLQRREPAAEHAAVALQASERARARNLLELLTEARADIRSGVDARLLERERQLRQALNDKAAAEFTLAPGEANGERAALLAKELRELTAQVQEVAAQIRAQSPRYAALTQPQPLTLAELQRQVLDADTLLLEYSLGAERSFLWAVTPTTLNSYELPNREVLEAAARRCYDLLAAPSRIPPHETAAQRGLRLRQSTEQFALAAMELSRLLLAPVAEQLGRKRLVIVADGALHYLPFGALSDPRVKAGRGQPLLVEHEVVHLPSASTLAVLRRELAGRKPAPQTLAVLADPVFSVDDERLKPRTPPPAAQPPAAQPPAAQLDDAVDDLLTQRLLKKLVFAKASPAIARLPFTRQEAEQILALVPPNTALQALDFEASRATATSERLSQYRYVHFATHGLADSERAELSTIVLSLFDAQGRAVDGFLRAHEIYNLNLPAELVVLSACETGLGKLTKGEGLVSLTRGFMYAGAARVVVSLWAVNDRATAELMAGFYRKMLSEAQRPAAALRAAQLELWKTKQWEAPYYWAAFTLQGEWR